MFLGERTNIMGKIVGPDPLPRRQFLQFAVGGSLSLGAACMAEATAVPRREVDVAIIGAGLAGLTAARALRRQKITLCVLEARDRVGGRTLDHAVGGGNVAEGGGQWAGPTQTAVLDLAKELGVETFKTHSKGKTVIMVGGTRLTAAADERDESADLRHAKEKLDAMAKEVPLADPWTAKNAKEWDAITVADWLKANAKRETREEIAMELETELGPATGTSLLWFLFYVHSAGSIHGLNVEAQELRFKGGPQSLSKKMAATSGMTCIYRRP
jgi:monoamine oxidase